jgi:hypothetical protein
MMFCPQCNAENLTGALVCGKCGFLLGSQIGERTEKVQLGDVLKQTNLIIPQPPVTQPTATDNLDFGMMAFYISNSTTPLILPTSTPLLIGRTNHTKNRQPQVDLTGFGGHVFGVSREHAEIQQTLFGYSIKDLGSSNGTTLNGISLNAHLEYPLKSEDQLKVGMITIKVVFKNVNTENLPTTHLLNQNDKKEDITPSHGTQIITTDDDVRPLNSSPDVHQNGSPS